MKNLSLDRVYCCVFMVWVCLCVCVCDTCMFVCMCVCMCLHCACFLSFFYSGLFVFILYLFSNATERRNMELSIWGGGEDVGGDGGGEANIKIYFIFY